MEQHDTAKARKQLWGLIKDIKFAMFTTRHDNGHLHSRPMTTQNKSVDEDTSLWFFVSRDNNLLEDIAEEPNANIVYAHPGADSYVSVSGTAQLVENQAKKEQLWSPLAKGWFPQGVTDPNLALVQVQITHANYWDVKSSKLVQLFALAKASLTGKPPRDIGEHGEVRMR